MAPTVARSGCWASRAPRQGRQHLYRRSANLLTTGGQTAVQLARPYGGAVFQTSSACARAWGRGGLGERALGQRARAATETKGRGREAALARGGAASRLGARVGAPAAPGEFLVSAWRYSTGFSSKSLNRSALCGE
jgi:hypothetical protein